MGRPISNIKRAVPAMLFACLMYAILGAGVKEELTHLSVPGILFWRYTIALILFVPWMLYQRRGHACDLKPTSFKMYWIRVGLTLTSIYLYCAALKGLSIGMTTLFFNTLPLFVPLVTRVWKKVPINHNLWWGFGIALAGVGLVLSPGSGVWNKDLLFAVGAGLCGACSVVTLRYTHFEEPAYRINFYFFFLALLLTIPMTFFNVHTSWGALTVQDILPLLLIGVTGFLYQQSFSFALKHAPARFLAPFMYSMVVWGSFLDWWLWGTLLTTVAWMGIGLVICGNILIYLLYPKKDLTS